MKNVNGMAKQVAKNKNTSAENENRYHKGGRPEKPKEEVIFKRYTINTTQAESAAFERLYAKQKAIKPGSISDYLKQRILQSNQADKRAAKLSDAGLTEAQLSAIQSPDFLVMVSEISKTLRGVATNYNQSLKRLHTLVIPAHQQAELINQGGLLTEIRSLIEQTRQLLRLPTDKDNGSTNEAA